jgi:hypothetical protein
VPTIVTVAPNEQQAQFSVLANAPTDAAAGQTWTRITAALSGVEQETGLWVRASTPFLLALRPRSALARAQTVDSVTTGNLVMLSRPAPAGGAEVQLASNNSLVVVPATVTVPAGTSSATFDILQLQPVFERSAARLTASYGGVTRVADVAFGIQASATLQGVTLTGTALALRCLDGDEQGLLSPDRAFRTIVVSLDGIAPPGYEVEIYATRQRVLRLLTRITALGGERELQLEIRPAHLIGDARDDDDEPDILRFLDIVARATYTGEEVRAPVAVAIIDNPEKPIIDFINVDTLPARGGRRLRGFVRPDIAHPFDDVPFDVRLQIGDGPTVATAAGTISTGLRQAAFELDVPDVASAVDATLSAHVDDPCFVFVDSAVQPIQIAPPGGGLSRLTLARDT